MSDSDPQCSPTVITCKWPLLFKLYAAVPGALRVMLRRQRPARAAGETGRATRASQFDLGGDSDSEPGPMRISSVRPWGRKPGLSLGQAPCETRSAGRELSLEDRLILQPDLAELDYLVAMGEAFSEETERQIRFATESTPVE